MKDALHRCDRAMIYIFIAASYFPWLNVEHFLDDELLFAMRYVVWIMAIMGILYQQIFHEKYKMLETIFYVVMGIGPSVAILNVVSKAFELSFKLNIVSGNVNEKYLFLEQTRITLTYIKYLYSVTITILRN